MQSKFTDKVYLQTDQYRDSRNLRARMQIHERFSTNPYGWHLWVFDQLNLPPECRILEVGCGPGKQWPPNLERIPRGWNLVLSDFSAGMIREASQTLQKAAARFQFTVLDAQSIPFAPESFDAVIANHMLYHVPDLQAALSEIRRVLKPGAGLYAATNGEAHLVEMTGLVKRFDANLPYEPGELDFNLENGSELLKLQFKQVEKRLYIDSLEVTEAEPLVAYILSMYHNAGLLTRREDFHRFIEQEIASQGAIHITKSVGLFIAIK